MPIYEYRCKKCAKKTEFITFRVSETVDAVCRHCGGLDMELAPSRIRVRLSEETRMERLADPSRLGGLDENDPKSMARWMKQMSHEMGEDMGGEDVDAMIEQAMEEESGGYASPESSELDGF
ncbi:MAG: FmdB family zinc ribbon protein [Syntrophobacteraceae bacterium]